MEEYWDEEYFNRTCINAMEALSKIPVLGARGNHEDDVRVYQKYWPYPYESGGFYYAFGYGPVHISVIDQYSDYSPSSEQYRWLENTLSLSDKKWKFILLHEPGFSAEGSHGDNFYVETIIHPLCRKYGVSGVFAGHNHFYAHCIIDGVHHLTFGGRMMLKRKLTALRTVIDLASYPKGIYFAKIGASAPPVKIILF